MALPANHSVTVFSLRSGRALAERVCAQLGIAVGQHEERDFEDGEHKLRPLESVRGRDVYVVQSLHGDHEHSVNDKLARVLFFVATLVDSGARRVTLVAPYLCYARKDLRTKPRDPVTTRYVAALFEAMRVDHVLTIDVHNVAAFENAWRIPRDNLSAAPTLAGVFADIVGDREAVVVSPDAGGVKRAERFRAALERRLARPVPLAFVEKFRSEGVVRGGTVVGPVERRVAVIVDDLISSGTTLALAAKACRESGAVAAYATVTHGVFAPEASSLLAGSEIERLVLFDTISPPRIVPELLGERVQVLDCAPLVGSAIERLATGGSLHELDA